MVLVLVLWVVCGCVYGEGGIPTRTPKKRPSPQHRLFALASPFDSSRPYHPTPHQPYIYIKIYTPSINQSALPRFVLSTRSAALSRRPRSQHHRHTHMHIHMHTYTYTYIKIYIHNIDAPRFVLSTLCKPLAAAQLAISACARLTMSALGASMRVEAAIAFFWLLPCLWLFG